MAAAAREHDLLSDKIKCFGSIHHVSIERDGCITSKKVNTASSASPDSGRNSRACAQRSVQLRGTISAKINKYRTLPSASFSNRSSAQLVFSLCPLHSQLDSGGLKRIRKPWCLLSIDVVND